MNADDLLNLAARVLLEALPPLKVHAVMTRMGAWLPQRLTIDEVRAAARSMRRRGTCLSRALALAARAPDAEVVIGVSPEGGSGLQAHAWIEIRGEPLAGDDPLGREIARLPASDAAR